MDLKNPGECLTLASNVSEMFNEGVMAQWCNPLTLQAEQSGGAGSR